jgi:endonuclease III
MKRVSIEKVYLGLVKETALYNAPVVDLVAVQTNDPFKILIATILSARTKDETTAKVCTTLFTKIKKISDLTTFTENELAKMIFPVGFYKTKAKHLHKLPAVLKEKFNNVLPETVEELTELPGVGRKTANLVVALAFKKPAICVDIHVHRIMNRLGYIRTKTPLETEMRLRSKLPKKYWQTINSLFVAFGQNLCRPVSPYCSKCPIRTQCNRIGVKTSR